MADGQAEKVDHLVGVRPDEMRAEDEVRPLVDQNFVAIDRLGEPAGGEPVRRRGRVNPELEAAAARSEEHTSELQSLMRLSYAVFCLKKKKYTKQHTDDIPSL